MILNLLRKGESKTADVNSFVFYASFRDAYEALKTTGQDREYMDALLKFAFDGETTRTGDTITDAFISAFEPQIMANKKRRENGKKGGAPKKNKNAQKQPKVEFEKTKKQSNENVNVNVNKNVNVNAKGNSCGFDRELFSQAAKNPVYHKREEPQEENNPDYLPF